MILGAGSAGLVLALGLARAGHSVAIVERRSRPGANGADILKPSGIEVLSGLGLMDALEARGARRRTMLEVHHDRRLLTTIDYRRTSELGYFLVAPYAILLAALMTSLESLPNVHLYFGAEVSAIERRGEQVERVRLADGRTLRAAVYVGADGARSGLRDALGLTVERRLYAQKMYLASFPLVASVEQRNRLHVDAAGGLAYFYPIDRRALRVVVGLPADEGERLFQRPGDAGALRQRLSATVGEASADALASIDDVGAFTEIPIACMNLSRYGAGNAVLVGDAIHNVHPITGQGMNLSIEDAEALTRHLTPALAGATSVADAIAAYQDERHPINEAVVGYGHRLATSLHDRDRFAAALVARLQTSSRRSDDLDLTAGVLRQ